MKKIYRIDTFDSKDYPDLIFEENGFIVELKIQVHFRNGHSHYRICSHFQHCEALTEQNIADYFFKNSQQYSQGDYPGAKLSEIFKIPGEYYPSIYRPILPVINYASNFISIDKTNKYDYFPHDPNTLVKSVQQLSTLTIRLNSIFNNVYPTQDNLNCYGHEIRNLLILTCTEVEAQFKGVLAANDIDTSMMYKTSDYIKLKEILKLSEYKLALSHFPEVEPISPFKAWDKTNPTSSLFWYDNYNAVKHDREGNFHKANLESAINAICAVAILLYAQYGNNIPNWKELVGNYFEKVDEPKWQFMDHYFPPFCSEEWVQKNISI